MKAKYCIIFKILLSAIFGISIFFLTILLIRFKSDLDRGWFFEWLQWKQTDPPDNFPLDHVEILIISGFFGLVFGIPLGCISFRSKEKTKLFTRNFIFVLILILPHFIELFCYLFKETWGIIPSDFLPPFKSLIYPTYSRFRLYNYCKNGQFEWLFRTLRYYFYPILSISIPLIGITMWITRGIINDVRSHKDFAQKWILRGFFTLLAMLLYIFSLNSFYRIPAIGSYSYILKYLDYPYFQSVSIRLALIISIFYIVFSTICYILEFVTHSKWKKQETKVLDYRRSNDSIIKKKTTDKSKQKINKAKKLKIPIRFYVALAILTFLASFFIISLRFTIPRYYYLEYLYIVDNPAQFLPELIVLVAFHFIANSAIISLISFVFGSILISLYELMNEKIKRKMLMRFLSYFLRAIVTILIIVLIIRLFFRNVGYISHFSFYPEQSNLIRDSKLLINAGLIGGLTCFQFTHIFSKSSFSDESKPNHKNSSNKYRILRRFTSLFFISIIFGLLFMLAVEFCQDLLNTLYIYSPTILIDEFSYYDPIWMKMAPVFSLFASFYLIFWCFSSIDSAITRVTILVEEKHTTNKIEKSENNYK